MLRTWQVATIFAVLSVGAAFFSLGVPLPCLVDSSSYYMNAQFLRTGQYIWPDWYPSFTGPNQFSFPLGGYSLWVYACRALEDGTGIPWFLWLKAIQFACYLHAGYLLFAIASRLGRPLAGLAGMVLYFAYFPFLNLATLILSETAAIWLVLLILWLVLKGVQENRPFLAGLSFFFAGYSLLVRTVLGVTCPLILLTALLMRRKQWSVRTWCLLVGLMAACPLAQSLWNRSVFGNYRLRAGNMFNFYDRVIAGDQSVPRESPYGEALRHTVYKRGDVQWYGFCYDLEAYLSDQGYTKEQVEEIIGDIAWAGFAQNKARYFWKTLESTAWVALAHGTPERVFLNHERVFGDTRVFGRCDTQQAYLAGDLIRQESYYRGCALAGTSMEAHSRFADAYDLLAAGLYLQYVIIAGYLVWLGFVAFRLCRPGGRAEIPELLLALVGILIVLGSCLFEARAVRYRLPAQPLLILGFVLALAELRRLRPRRRGEAGAVLPPPANPEKSVS